MAIRYREGRKAPWIVYWKNPYTGKTEELPCLTEDQAKKENSLIRHRLKYERESFRPEDEEEISGTSFEACYYLYLKEKKFTKSNLERNIGNMKLALTLLGQKDISTIDYQELENLKTKLLDSGIAKTSVRRRLGAVYAIINWCKGKNFIAVTPDMPKLPPAHYKKFIPPTPQELEVICKVAAPHIIRVALLGARLGIRIGQSELLKLEWIHFDFERQIVRVIAAKKNPTQPWREVPLRSDFIPLLKKWRDEDSAQGIKHVITYHGKPVKKIWKAWNNTVKRAGIERSIRPYDLRHAFATEALAAGADLKAVAEIMGDNPRTILEYYQHVSGAQKRSAVENLPVMDFTANIYGTSNYDPYD